MARLHEYQGKAILARHGFAIPRGGPASTPEQAAQMAKALAGHVVIKIQAWITGRAAIGGVAFADTPDQARQHAERMLKIRVGNFPVSEVLVEEKIKIAKELFVSLSIDDRERSPVILLSFSGGSGIEDRAAQVHRFVCDVAAGPDLAAVERAVQSADLPPASRTEVAAAVLNVFNTARSIEARSVEINPLVITADGRVMAADCRMTVDDYALANGRHADLGIDMARELDHPPTELEKVAYRVEQEDHRGTFFFAQMNTAAAAGGGGSKGLIGFHGAGGGGSMMSMDAITNEGFTIANFCDTSGNPSPAKVYRAARIILSQPGLIGYFGSGSGVANQEQYWSAYGLAKAFWELELDIPAVIRLGGNTEDRAVEILQTACRSAGLKATVEGYTKNDTPAKIAARIASLVASSAANGRAWTPRAPRRPLFVGSDRACSFPVKGGRVWIDSDAWKAHAGAIVARSSGLLRDEGGRPALAAGVTPDAFMGKDSEMIACEVECRRDGIGGAAGAVFVALDLPDAARAD